MESLDSIARRYGVLPSAVVRQNHPLKALSIDIWAHNAGVQREQLEAEKMKWKGRGRPRG
jgi:hypothetical protein